MLLVESANSLSTTINLKEILAVHLGGSKTERHHSVDKGASGSVQSSFCVYSVKLVGKHRRRPHKIVFHCSDHSVAVKWVSVFNQILSKRGKLLYMNILIVLLLSLVWPSIKSCS